MKHNLVRSVTGIDIDSNISSPNISENKQFIPYLKFIVDMPRCLNFWNEILQNERNILSYAARKTRRLQVKGWLRTPIDNSPKDY